MKDRIKKILNDEIEIHELSVEGPDAKYEINIISDVFEGKSIINRHKIIYSLLNDYIKTGEIHALTIKAKTVGESDK